MKLSNRIIYFIAAVLFMTVFFMPVTVLANDEVDESVEELEVVPLSESVIPDTSKAFTSDGQATVIDVSYEGDGKMFYTFKTPDGNVFYLVIDRERKTDNVYFLSAVTEDDLLAITGNSNKKSNSSTSAIPKDEPSTPGQNQSEPKDPLEPSEPPPKQGNGYTSLLILVLVSLLVVVGVAYYFKVIRPKKQSSANDDDDDFSDEDEDDDDEIEFDDPDE